MTNAKFYGDKETAKRLFSENLLRALKKRNDWLDAVQMNNEFNRALFTGDDYLSFSPCRTSLPLTMYTTYSARLRA